MPADTTANESFHVDLPEVRMHVVTPNEPVAGKVVRSELCTLGGSKAAGIVRHVEIDVSGTPLAGSFRIGQSFGVVTPGVDERGKPHKVRLYSIASPSSGEDGKGNVISTTVKRTIHELGEEHRLYLGVASNHICDREVGDELLLTGPNGKRFLLPARPEEHDYVFIATGTGIAPFRGMVQELIEAGINRRITLVMGAPYRSDLLYHDDFLALEREHENFQYVTVVSRESVEGRPRQYVDQGVLAAAERLTPQLMSGEALVYVCGIAGMELGVLRALAEMLESDPEALARYIECDEQTLATRDAWDRRMIRREVRPTRRIFLEVY